MNFLWAVLATTTSLNALVTATPAKRYYDTHAYYAMEYIPDARSEVSLPDVIKALGVEMVEQAGELRDVWLLRVPKAELDARSEALGRDPVLAAFRDLQAKASSHISSRSEEAVVARNAVSSVRFLERQTPQNLVKRAPPPVPRSPTSALGIAKRLGLRDPLFPEQWHLVNDEFPEHMMNTTPVWDMGFTGKGVMTSFLDDGLDFEHDDLKDAFDAENSYDFNNHVALPRPVGPDDDHGTRCAGQVAARRNEACGVGIAYDAKAAGVRILGGRISSVDEAAALNYGFQKVSIYSCSWGPRDNGQLMSGPSYLIRKAVVNGVNEGRDGKGSIFVFASGNGGDYQDQCNFDGYTNSIYSVTVSSIDFKGLHPSYSEACAANMIVAYSSGSKKHIVTTDRGENQCTHGHGGTSAAAPNAVGVFALALQARPDLTWRDIQHLCVETARLVNPNDPDWERTAAGRMYSYKYGYGALDAYAYVKAAQTWKLVKPQAWLHTETVQINGGKMHDLEHGNYSYKGGARIGPDGIEAKMIITKDMTVKNNLEELEHIDIRVWISHTKRGDVEVELVSPNGIKSVLASMREYDDATTGFPGWRFMTIKHWGENPVGDWTLRVFDQNDPQEYGRFLGWNMALWGSAIDPAKAEKFVEPVVDNALPPPQSPPRPVIDDTSLTSTTQHSKPTDHLPPDHGHAPGENTRPAFPVATGRPPPKQDEDAYSQKWYFASLGAVVGLVAGAVLYLWRRRVARQRLAEYTSLARDDIHMDDVAENHAIPGGGVSRSAMYNLPSSDELTAQPFLQPPTARGLGFHSGFLDDDEPSPLPPKYRDEHEESGHGSDLQRKSVESQGSTFSEVHSESREHPRVV